MKTNIVNGIIIFLLGLLSPQIAQAQGTITYLSSLSPTSTGNAAVSSDSWLAAGFGTGNNPDGYTLDSIQLAMTDTSGNPSDFTAMIYNEANNPAAILPGSSLGTLSGSDNPSTSGIFTYTDDSNIILSPSTEYFIVLTAGTMVANGAYEWEESAYPPSINMWGVDNGVLHSSNNGSSWSFTPYSGIAQFAITATPIPEPSPSLLILLGSGILFYVRRAFHR
ncbi:MAG TPA: choice-of-anchor R domain-containing protein [Verrucomicrobiae bacterium]|jgi:hypothetical protein